jgi:prefoldin subunit 5
MMNNYPPGVTGNEPQISGIYPPDQVIDSVDSDLDKVKRTVEEAMAFLEDQKGSLDDSMEKLYVAIINDISDLQNEVRMLMPEEPEYNEDDPIPF